MRYCAALRRFDDLQNYSNERSIFLAILRDAIEAPWQEWELQQLPEQEKLSPPEVRMITTLCCYISSVGG